MALLVDGYVVRWGDRAPSYREVAPRGSVRLGVSVVDVWQHHFVQMSGRASVLIGSADRFGRGPRGLLEFSTVGIRLRLPVIDTTACRDTARLVDAGALRGWSMEFPESGGARVMLPDGSWALKDVRMVGVALVPRPAFPGSSVRLVEV